MHFRNVLVVSNLRIDFLSDFICRRNFGQQWYGKLADVYNLLSRHESFLFKRDNCVAVQGMAPFFRQMRLSE